MVTYSTIGTDTESLTATSAQLLDDDFGFDENGNTFMTIREFETVEKFLRLAGECL